MYLSNAFASDDVNIKRNKDGLNSQFSSFKTGCLTKTKEPSLPYYLSRDGERGEEIHAFEMQRTSFRIWTWVADSISFCDNRYAKRIFVYFVSSDFSCK